MGDETKAPCEGRETHYTGCECHEARRDAEVERLAKELADDPSKDETPEAHPAWWRGYHADKGELASMVDVARAEARAAHARVALLEAERDEARTRQRAAEAALAAARREGAEEMRERAAHAVEPAGWASEDDDPYDGYDRWDIADALAGVVRALPLDAPVAGGES